MPVDKRIEEARRAYRRWLEKAKQKLEDRKDNHKVELEQRIKDIRKAQDKHGDPFRLFDSVDTGQLPAKADAYGGYIGGSWPTFEWLKANHPEALLVSIAVASRYDAMVLDVETGDATNADAPAWFHRQKAKGVKKPGLYTFLSNGQPLIDALGRAGIKRDEYFLWLAHWTGQPHICGPGCGFGLKEVADATQFTDKSGGHNLDESLCSPKFLN